MMVMQRDPIQDVPTSARMAEISFGVGGRSQLHGMDATTLAARLTEKNVPISRATGKARRFASLSCAPVVLGLDLAGVVVAVGHGVSGLEVSDAVAAMTGLNCDGGWVAAGGNGRGEGGYAVARQFLTAGKPPSLSFRDAAALPMAFLSAFAGLYRAVQGGDTVYIPGGGGGVGHLAVQMAARALGAGLVISSGSTPQSIALARQSGARHVFDYKRDDVAAEIAKLTGGRGVDVVFDATYSEQGFVETAKTVRRGGSWIVLGVGPGKTTRLVETHSPVDAILAERDARQVNVNLLRYFSEPATLDDEARAFLHRGMALAMEWATQGLVVP